MVFLRRSCLKSQHYPALSNDFSNPAKHSLNAQAPFLQPYQTIERGEHVVERRNIAQHTGFVQTVR